MFSFWEKNSFLNYDYIIIGGGLLGLSVACEIKENHPDREVLILERGILPSGASTKNAGFLCYGSLTEILGDIRTMGEDKTVSLIEKRWRGMNMLRQRLGDDNIGYINCGEYELIDDKYLESLNEISYINRILKDIFGDDEVFRISDNAISVFGFNPDVVKSMVFSPYEAQIDTGKMMRSMMKYAVGSGILYFTGAEVKGFEEKDAEVEIFVENQHSQLMTCFKSPWIVICTNAFTSYLTGEKWPTPARGLVLATKPVKGLKLNGIYHYDEGYYYFRNYRDRVILGGARNLDFEVEQTDEFGVNEKIYHALLKFLAEVILPDREHEIDTVWSGIMGFTGNKLPGIRKISDKIISIVSCNGMGIALSSVIAEEVVNELFS